MILPTIDVWLANDNDVGSIGGVHRDSVKSLCATHYSRGQLDAWFEDRPPNMYVNAIREGRIWVAVEHENLVGFVEIRPGEIEKLFVRGISAGCGIGSELLRIGIERVRDASIDAVTVLATLNARTFYERHGFRQIGETCLLRGRLKTRIDVLHMELR